MDDDGDAEIHMYEDNHSLCPGPSYDMMVFTLDRVLAKLYTWCPSQKDYVQVAEPEAVQWTQANHTATRPSHQ